MGLLSKLKSILGFSPQQELVKVRVICDSCGQEIDSVFRRGYDLQPTYAEQDYDYSITKQLVCSGCYKSLELELELDNNLDVLNSELDEGELILDIDE
ncbi:hypothetical protein [Halanaerobaculum tunisiense]